MENTQIKRIIIIVKNVQNLTLLHIMENAYMLMKNQNVIYNSKFMIKMKKIIVNIVLMDIILIHNFIHVMKIV